MTIDAAGLLNGPDDAGSSAVSGADASAIFALAHDDASHPVSDAGPLSAPAAERSRVVNNNSAMPAARGSTWHDDVDIERALHLLREHRSIDAAMTAVLQEAVRDGARLRDAVALLNDLARRLLHGQEISKSPLSEAAVTTHDLHALAEAFDLARGMSLRLRHGLMTVVAATEAQDAVVAGAIHALSPAPLLAVHVVRVGTATAALPSGSLAGVYPIAPGALIPAANGHHVVKTEKGVLTVSPASLDNSAHEVGPRDGGVGLGVVGRDDLLFVDALVREDEVVSEPTPSYLRRLCGIIGCIDGGAAPVVPVVDPTLLLRLWDLPPRW